MVAVIYFGARLFDVIQFDRKRPDKKACLFKFIQAHPP